MSMREEMRRDAVARGATVHRLGPGFRWPGGHRIAVVFNVAYEAWSDGAAPGLGPMGNPLPAGVFDTNAVSWGHYGAVRGISRLLDVLDRTGIRASVMVSGILATRAPDTVNAIARAGHEIVAHAFAQDIIPARLTAEDERAGIAVTTDALAEAAGTRPVGWISPRGTPGPDTARRLLKAGYEWHGDVFDDDLPYVQSFAEGRIIAIPLTMEVNDLPHAMRFGRSPRQFIEMFEEHLTNALSRDGDTIMIDVTAHAHVYGRPAGAWAIEAIASRIRTRQDVWIGTRGGIAACVRASSGHF